MEQVIQRIMAQFFRITGTRPTASAEDAMEGVLKREIGPLLTVAGLTPQSFWLMACPTCSHTLDKIGREEEHCHVFHCIRCGTMVLRWPSLKKETVYAPNLVERCREFETRLPSEPNSYRLPWVALGIAESIHPAK